MYLIQGTARPALTIVRNRQYFKDLTDVQLIAACQHKEKDAFDELVRRYQRMVNGTLRQLAPDWADHSDLSQEVFIRIWRSLHTLRNPECFRTWLHQICVNIFYDHLRKRPKQTIISLEAPVQFDDGGQECVREVPDTSRLPDEMVQRKELAAAIDSAVARLPVQFREAIVLRDVQGLSYDEIAVITHSEVGTVKSRISRARGRVQKIVSRKYKDCA